MTMYILNVHVG